MKPSDLTIMQHFSISEPVFMAEQSVGPDQRVQTGFTAAVFASWLEKHGATETSILECWKPLAPHIWLATSPKK